MIHPILLSKAYVGNIINDTLRVYDNDNYHEQSKSLGLDDAVVISPELEYKFIHFHFENYDYITTRVYFYHKARRQRLLNGRDQKFLELKMFGKTRAIEWEEYMINLETAQLDLFKVLDEQRKTGEKNNEYLNEWEEKNKQVQEYRIKQKKLVL